jgi:hypothetical protein
MALDRKPVMVRLTDEAYDALRLLSELEEKDLGEKGREIIERVLLGEVHAARMQAARFARLTNSGNARKRAQAGADGPDLFTGKSEGTTQ